MAAAPGTSGRIRHVVGAADSAHTLGNPGVYVLATPRLAELCDRAAAAAVPEATSHMRIDIRHLAATPVGDTVEIDAVLEAIEDRRLVFRVSGRDSKRDIVAGRVERVLAR
jgi:fluoroacetyl-CoA thioesterase